MSNLPVLRNGFLKLTRLGPPKIVKQVKNDRAPENHGLWAFPWPYFDLFFAYHRYTLLLPKHLQGYYPSSPEFFRRLDNDEPIESLEGFSKDEDGYYDDLYPSSEWGELREKWITNVGMKIEKRRSFWYSGPIYTHIRANKEIDYGGFLGAIAGTENEWNLTDTSDLYRRILRVSGEVSREKGQTYRNSHDHLEVFVPRSGMIRSSPR